MSNFFNYYTPTKVFFGKDTLNKLVVLLNDQKVKKVLIHYGSGNIVQSGLLNKITNLLEENNINFVTLGGVVPNPHLSLVYEGIKLAKEEKIDFILAVGGGSVIDSSKAICYGLGNKDEDVWDFYLKTKNPVGFFPLGVILTIAAAGSEMSNSSVITNEKTHEKRGVNSDLSRPLFAIMDPTITLTLPTYQTFSGCTDILMHTLERYFVNGGNLELTDSIAEGLIKSVMKNALILKDNPNDYEARASIMWASSLSHNGLTGCGIATGDFASHALEHEMGGLYDCAHGAGLAVIWPSWARYVYKDCLNRFVKFSKNIFDINEGTDEEIALKGIKMMENFFTSIGMPVSFKELGINPSKEEIKIMANGVMKAKNGVVGSAKKLYLDDCIKIYHMANHE